MSKYFPSARKHFKSSQFIIALLKNEMFNNAVLFKTRFVNGISAITRIGRARTKSKTKKMLN